MATETRTVSICTSSQPTARQNRNGVRARLASLARCLPNIVGRWNRLPAALTAPCALGPAQTMALAPRRTPSSRPRGAQSSSRPIVESHQIGQGGRVGASTHIHEGAVIGSGCYIGDHCSIESGTTIGTGVEIRNAATLCSGLALGDHVFVGPNVAFTNDLFPRAKIVNPKVQPIVVEEGASVGANATVVGPVKVGRYALIGAGAIVTRDVPAFALVYGNPARQHAWVCRCGRPLEFNSARIRLACCSCGLKYGLPGKVLVEHA